MGAGRGPEKRLGTGAASGVMYGNCYGSLVNLIAVNPSVTRTGDIGDMPSVGVCLLAGYIATLARQSP
jgi:hypothetical protein